MKGAFEEVVRYCTMYNNGGIPLPLTPQQRSLCQQAEKRMGSLGLRGQCLWPAPGLAFACHADFPGALMQGPQSVRWWSEWQQAVASESQASVERIGSPPPKTPVNAGAAQDEERRPRP